MSDRLKFQLIFCLFLLKIFYTCVVGKYYIVTDADFLNLYYCEFKKIDS